MLRKRLAVSKKKQRKDEAFEYYTKKKLVLAPDASKNKNAEEE